VIHTDWLESCGARAAICVVAWAFVGLIALLAANGAEIEGASTLLRYDWYDLPLDVELGIEHVDPGSAARLIAFAEIGRDRCGLGPFPTWSLFKRYGLRERDFKVAMESVGERSGDSAIGPYFQLLLDAEDEAARVFGERGTVEGCRLIRNEVAKHVKIDD
jgi:hypothetical protein